MATYLTGDIQGCFDELQQLLAQVEFNPTNDQLWLTGDLVARGPKSLETLRFVKSLGDSAVTVLGNHDLHLLACAKGFAKVKAKDLLDDLMQATDRDELLDWLRHQPLLAKHEQYNFVMTHAGIPPQWSVKQAKKAARVIENKLRSEAFPTLLKQMYGNGPNLWHKDLSEVEHDRFTINALTRMRFVDKNDHALDMAHKTATVDDKQLVPWFQCRAQHDDPVIFFGHWASLEGVTNQANVIALDTGCVWGNSLSLYCWETETLISQPCPLQAK
ncbi:MULTISPECIES: symmetrical bis(5'-nucleosyl)-tetraphosphatase [Corallincola]|uniref:bis(5'-nucleosyl)-tetraphosphatase (symmetrical) n=2 Tax=Corallincola TaxID=1775176 RepID=A0A368NJK0_9GAMM|nr:MULTISPECIES: symmetrical bis(5'-nucleosyl)-tetraphosphatase [Corallincola]RCU49945.1 symmetrical bis(5'-nucleosyl)-tetraphosphatase [Corallincola holothuriorum]TAA45077.1 symmetrical bis(5'-nucleosyl)-tetraphosphatase [Corallincola spongiicola]